jgi:ABC-type transporter Mla subunit MlaD
MISTVRFGHHPQPGARIVSLKPVVTAVALASLALAPLACGSDSKSSSSSTTTPTEAVCADKNALEKSVRSLSDSETISGGKSTIDAGLKKVKKNLEALRDSVKADLKPQVDELQDALDELQTVVGDFGSGSITENLKDAGQAISKVGTSAGALATSLDTDCP